MELYEKMNIGEVVAGVKRLENDTRGEGSVVLEAMISN